MSDDRPVILDGEEADLLARRLVALHLEDHGEWLLWEDLPNLSEQSFEMLGGAIVDLAGDLCPPGDGASVAAALHRRAS